MAEELGQRLRQLRKQRGLSLEQVSASCGVALATLSRLENGKGTGTFRTHRKIAEAFGLSLAELYRDLQSPEQEALLMKTADEEIEAFNYDEKASAIFLTRQIAGKQMLPQMILLQPGGKTAEEQYMPGTERWVFGLEGSFFAKVGQQEHPVASSEALYFKASLSHQFRNDGTIPAKLISVMSPATF